MNAIHYKYRKCIVAVSLFLIFSNVSNAQGYAAFYNIWDNFIGHWTGRGGTSVDISRQEGEEMQIRISFNGKKYRDFLLCVSPTYATAQDLTREDTGLYSGLQAGISLSSGTPILKLYTNNSNTAIFESRLSKAKAKHIFIREKRTKPVTNNK